MKNSNVLNPRNDAKVNEAVITGIKKASNKKNDHKQNHLPSSMDDQTVLDDHKLLNSVLERLKKFCKDDDEFLKIYFKLKDAQGEYLLLSETFDAEVKKHCLNIRETLISTINFYDHFSNLKPAENWTSVFRFCAQLLYQYKKLEDPCKYDFMVKSIKPEIHEKIQSIEI